GQPGARRLEIAIGKDPAVRQLDRRAGPVGGEAGGEDVVEIAVHRILRRAVARSACGVGGGLYRIRPSGWAPSGGKIDESSRGRWPATLSPDLADAPRRPADTGGDRRDVLDQERLRSATKADSGQMEPLQCHRRA